MKLFAIVLTLLSVAYFCAITNGKSSSGRVGVSGQLGISGKLGISGRLGAGFLERLLKYTNKVFPIISVSVELVFTNYSNANFIPAMTVSVSQGSNAFDVLQQASQQNPCFRSEYIEYSFGRYITTICCLEQDSTPQGGFSWFIYNNTELSPVGVDDLIPEDGDTITFKYELPPQNNGN